MAQAIILPKLGNTVESAIILAWHVAVGDQVRVGDLLCEIETDKATLEVESSADGVLLARLREAGDEAPVLSNIAVVGRAGESFTEFTAAADGANAPPPNQSVAAPKISAPGDATFSPSLNLRRGGPGEGSAPISPRARNLARRKGIDTAGLAGSGPEGRIIERDIEAALRERIKVTPVAQAMLDSGDFKLADGASAASRIGKTDLVPAERTDAVSAIPLKGARRIIAGRMLESLRTTAQLTLNASADARALGDFRRRLKTSDETLGLRDVGLNDLLLYAVARTLPAFPHLNALFENDTIYQHAAVHLALAVDTERGLLAPVIRNADSLTLRQIAAEAHRLAAACRAGTVQPDELTGGSFTVSNLGALGIESFTPILNPPQVAILGVGSISLKPAQLDEAVEFLPHIGLSLTINHQVVDGAPAARFLQQLSANLAQIDLLAAT